MKLCVIGMHKYFPKLALNELNMKTWRSLSPYFDEIHIIALSSNYRYHSLHEKNIFLYLTPNFKSKIVNLLFFYLYSLVVGLRITRQENTIIDASEPIGGGLSAVIIKFLVKRKISIHLQGEVLDPNIYGSITYLISRFISLQADVVRVVSKKVFNDAVRTGVPKEKICYVPQRVDIIQFKPREYAEYNDDITSLCNNSQIVVFVGSLVPVKGLTYLFQAFHSVIKNVQNAKLLIIGDGPQKKQLIKLAKYLNISNSVIFLGRISHSKIPYFLSRSHMLVLPSISEGMPRVILEAMACGLPVIASNVGGIPELIINQRNGLLIQSKDVVQLSNAIIYLLNNEEISITLGKYGRKYVEQNYNYDHGIELMVNMYNRLANP